MNTFPLMVNFKFTNYKTLSLMLVQFTEDGNVEERVLGLAMIPGKHVVSIAIDDVMLASQNSSYVT